MKILRKIINVLFCSVVEQAATRRELESVSDDLKKQKEKPKTPTRVIHPPPQVNNDVNQELVDFRNQMRILLNTASTNIVQAKQEILAV